MMPNLEFNISQTFFFLILKRWVLTQNQQSCAQKKTIALESGKQAFPSECLEELWMEVCNIVQEVVIKTIPKIKKCKKTKLLSEETLKIAEKRKEVKGKGEKERYIHLNAEFQRTARRDKKVFLSDQ